MATTAIDHSLVLQLEALAYKAEQLSSMAMAVQAAMFAPDENPDDYNMALRLLSDLMHDHATALRQLDDAVTACRKGGGTQ